MFIWISPSNLPFKKMFSSIIYHCQDMQTSSVSINRRMDKEDMVYIYIQWNTTQPLKKHKILPFAATWIDLGGHRAR